MTDTMISRGAEPRIDTSRPATLTMALSPGQRSIVSRFHDRRRDRRIAGAWIGFVAAMLFALYAVSRLDSRDVAIVVLLAVAAISLTLSATMTVLVIRSHSDVSSSNEVVRAIAPLTVDVDRSSEGPDLLYVDVPGGRRVVFDDEVGTRRSTLIGGIEFAARGGPPLAIWGREGTLLWHRAGYRPADAE